MANGYYGQARPEVMALVPETAKLILDIGCGEGALGKALKERQECFVVGVDRDAVPVSGTLDRFIMADIEEHFDPWEHCVNGQFDCIIMADVLEHLRDPQALLERAREWLAPEGVIVLSVPNARHWRIVEGLLRGDFSYQDAGLLDRGHLRFFTRRELQKALYRAGYEQVMLQAMPDPSGVTARTCGFAQGRLHVACESVNEAAEFTHYQYLAVAKPAAVLPGLPVSFIIPCWNQVEYTAQCLDSLRATVRVPYEVVLVNNGSTDGTSGYLASLSEWPELKVIRSEENLGWVKGVNLGLEAATGQTIVLLNNDTILPTGWLEPLLRGLWETEGAGLAGPCSNNVSGPQRVPATYGTTSEIDGWAWDVMGEHAGQVMECPRLVGFCLAARRECVDAIGGLDERFGIGLADDDDWCRRAHEAGFKTVIAAGSFVHHWGSMSFKQMDADEVNGLLQKNLGLLAEKYREG